MDIRINLYSGFLLFGHEYYIKMGGSIPFLCSKNPRHVGDGAEKVPILSKIMEFYQYI